MFSSELCSGGQQNLASHPLSILFPRPHCSKMVLINPAHQLWVPQIGTQMESHHPGRGLPVGPWDGLHYGEMQSVAIEEQRGPKEGRTPERMRQITEKNQAEEATDAMFIQLLKRVQVQPHIYRI